MNRRIVIVEDDPTIQNTLRDILLDEGYEAMTAGDGEAALELIPTYQPGLILLDLRMPLIDGIEFVERYHKEPVPHVPIIVLSASNEAKHVPSLEVAAFLPKPFTIDALLELVVHYIHPSAAAAEMT